MPDNLRAARPNGRRRRLKTFEGGRTCQEEGCDTRISVYNASEFCYAHSPRTFTRMRGVAVDG